MTAHDLSQVTIAANARGWLVERSDESGVQIIRKRGLPKFWIILGIILIPAAGIGIAILLIHFLTKAFGPYETRHITTDDIKLGFYSPFLR